MYKVDMSKMKPKRFSWKGLLLAVGIVSIVLFGFIIPWFVGVVTIFKLFINYNL